MYVYVNPEPRRMFQVDGDPPAISKTSVTADRRIARRSPLSAFVWIVISATLHPPASFQAICAAMTYRMMPIVFFTWPAASFFCISQAPRRDPAMDPAAVQASR